MERPSAAFARSVGLLDRRSACSMRPAASGMRAADSAAPRSSRIDRRTAVGASSSSARRRNRTAWSAEPRLLACRAEALSASNAHRSPTGPAGPAASRWAATRSHRAGSRASSRAAVRCSCTRSAGGIESCSACWTIGWTNLGGRPGCRSSASIKASTASAAALRSTPATTAMSASEASSPRIASVCATARAVGERRPQPSGHEPGHRRRTHGGDHLGIDDHVLPVSLLEGRDELMREQRVPASRSGHTRRRPHGPCPRRGCRAPARRWQPS